MRICLIFFSTLALSACASLNVRLPAAPQEAIKAEQEAQLRRAFDLYLTHNERLQKIASDILRANAPLCTKTRTDIGAQALRLTDLPKDLRQTAKAHYDLSEKSHIIYAGAQSGLKFGDVIERSGRPVKMQKAGFDKSGISVLRGGAAVDVDLDGVPACGYSVRLSYSPAINAYATGRSIRVTTAMMDFANDDELALIIGHELAHNTQGHVHKIVLNRVLALGFGTFSRQFETEADYVGLYYMARAGYDITGARDFWRKLTQVSVKSLNKAKSHPISPERYIRLAATDEEITRKRAQGIPLEPNSK